MVVNSPMVATGTLREKVKDFKSFKRYNILYTRGSAQRKLKRPQDLSCITFWQLPECRRSSVAITHQNMQPAHLQQTGQQM